MLDDHPSQPSPGSPPIPGSSVTSVIQHVPKPGALQAYESWLKDIVPVAARQPGHRGVNVIRPHGSSSIYTIVLHFDTLQNLEAWLTSGARRDLIARARPLLANDENIEIKTGLEFWFTPPPGTAPAARQVKAYKQFLISLSAIFPLSVLVPSGLQPVFNAVPGLVHPLLGKFIVAAVIVGLMVYVIMPRYTRLLAPWLFRAP